MTTYQTPGRMIKATNDKTSQLPGVSVVERAHEGAFGTLRVVFVKSTGTTDNINLLSTSKLIFYKAGFVHDPIDSITV